MVVKKEDMIALSVAILVLGLFCLFFWFMFIAPGKYAKNLCAESLNISYHWYYGFEDGQHVRYERIDDTKYNCCWTEEEPELTENGYEWRRKCKGFQRTK